MRPLSATDALSPAFARTRRLLTQRRSWATALKLTFIALLAEIGGGFNFNFNLGNNHNGQQPHLPHPAILGIAAVVAIFFAVFFLIGLALFYLGSRMQFVVFDLLLRQETQVGPSWRLFGPLTWRWIGIRLLILLAIGVLFSPLLIPVFLAFVHLVASPAIQTHPAAFFSLLLGYMGTILLVTFVLFLVFILVRTFGLPVLVLENTSISDTFQRTFDLFRADPGQSSLYLLLQIALRIGLLLGGYLATALVALISAIPPGILALVLYLATRSHGSVGKVLLVAACIVLGIIWLAWIFIAAIYLFGSVQLFLSAYALYFAAGRYAPLGNILTAQEPQLAWLTSYPPPQPAYTPPPTV